MSTSQQNWFGRATKALISAAGAALLASGPAWAQYVIDRHVIAGGSMQLSGGGYTLNGTLGQPDIGTMSGADYNLAGGFWGGGTGAVVGVEDGDEGNLPPVAFRLHSATPNPLVHGTVIALDVPRPVFVRARLYDTAGRLARTLVDEWLGAGRFQLTWDGTTEDGGAVEPGIYFVRVDADEFHGRQKIVVLK